MLPGSTRRKPTRPRNRRRDPAIGKLDFGVVDLCLIDIYDAFVLMDRGELRVELLFRNRVFAVSNLVTIEVDVCILEQRFVALILAFRLGQLRFKRTRIDLRQQVTLFDHLAFAIVDAHQLTINAAFDSHRVQQAQQNRVH